MATQEGAFPQEGGCVCGEVRYVVEREPIIVHACHCRWCQRETGASFALNAWFETNRLKVLKGEPEWVTVPTASNSGQSIARCPRCRLAVWSVYQYMNDNLRRNLRIVRVGTLDNPDLLPPNAHIWTSQKQPWIVLSGDAPAFERGEYDKAKVWSSQALERRRKIEELETPE